MGVPPSSIRARSTYRTPGEPTLGSGRGGPSAVGENWLLPGGDEAMAERLPDKCTLRLADN